MLKEESKDAKAMQEPSAKYQYLAAIVGKYQRNINPNNLTKICDFFYSEHSDAQPWCMHWMGLAECNFIDV